MSKNNPTILCKAPRTHTDHLQIEVDGIGVRLTYGNWARVLGFQPNVSDLQMLNAVREVEIARERTETMKRYYGGNSDSFWQALAQQKTQECRLVETTLRYFRKELT